MTRQIEAPETLSPRQYYARGGEMRIGLVPDDVLLVPRAAPEPGLKEEWGQGFVRVIPDEAFDDPMFAERDLSSRENVDTSVFLDRGRSIRLAIPIVSSPMRDVTGAELAIALGQVGGVGIIHRALPIEDQVAEVRRVKEKMGFVFERPPTLPPSATVSKARECMNKSGKGLVVVTDPDNHVLGIVTRRDVKKDIAPQDRRLDDGIMTPSTRVVTITPEVDTTNPHNIYVRRSKEGEKVRATDLMWQNRIEKLIIVDNEGHLIGAVCDYDLRLLREHPNATIDRKGQLVVGAAVGITDNYLERAEALVSTGANFLCVDVANAYLRTAREAFKELRRHFPQIPLMAGSIATRQGARIYGDLGADILRDNIGSGSICLTRGVSGSGYPSLTSVLEVADEADKYGIPVVADGGVRNSSDIAKFLAAGAYGVMLGRVLAGTEEAAGELIIDPQTRVKYREYCGMASEPVRRELQIAAGREPTSYSRKQEGVPRKVLIVGTVEEVTTDLVQGLRSGMTYGGVANIKQLRNEVDFIRMSALGLQESDVQIFP